MFGSSLTQLEPAPSHLLRSDALPSRTRTVSVAWGVPKLVEEDGEWKWRDDYLITGNSDSSFRRWDLPAPSSAGTNTGRVVIKGRAVVEKVNKKKGGHKGTIVWGVGVLPDETIVTSDSLGSVIFWDPVSLAQRQSFRSHKADGMCMTIGPGGRTVFTSGPDQRVCQFTAVKQANGSTQWALTSTKRVHSHDIRALAIFPPYVPLAASNALAPPPLNPGLAPVLASGGWDMAPVLTTAAAPELLVEKLRDPLGKEKGYKRIVFDEAYPRRLPMFGGERGAGRVSVAQGARLIVGRKDRSVGVWRVLDDEKGWEKVLEMDLKLRTNLIASAVSQDGQWLAVSDLYETKLFRLVPGVGGAIRPVRVREFLSDLVTSPLLSHLGLAQRGCGASALLFTPDSSRLVLSLAANAHVVVMDLDEDVSVLHSFAPAHNLVGGRSVKGKRARRRRRKEAAAAENSDVEMENGDDSESDDEPAQVNSPPAPWVTALSASDDGQYLATSDLGGKVTIFNLDTLQLHALLPTLPTAPVSISFTPTHPLLCLVLPQNTVSFYHLDAKRLVPPPPQLISLNNTLRGLHAAVEGAAFEPSRATPRAAKLVLYAHDWLATVRLDLDLIARAARGRAGSQSPSVLSSLGEQSHPESLTRAMRRKRAREARDALEASSPSIEAPPSPFQAARKTPSSAADPDFVKVATDRFRAICGAAWLGEGELALIERPYADFVGELPPAFWTGQYGRA